VGNGDGAIGAFVIATAVRVPWKAPNFYFAAVFGCGVFSDVIANFAALLASTFVFGVCTPVDGLTRFQELVLSSK
jgi:hypothetical protein